LQRHTFPKADQARILFVLNVSGEYKMAVQSAVIGRVSDSGILPIRTGLTRLALFCA
jgi:hypothetical protein